MKFRKSVSAGAGDRSFPEYYRDEIFCKNRWHPIPCRTPKLYIYRVSHRCHPPAGTRRYSSPPTAAVYAKVWFSYSQYYLLYFLIIMFYPSNRKAQIHPTECYRETWGVIYLYFWEPDSRQKAAGKHKHPICRYRFGETGTYRPIPESPYNHGSML